MRDLGHRSLTVSAATSGNAVGCQIGLKLENGGLPLEHFLVRRFCRFLQAYLDLELSNERLLYRTPLVPWGGQESWLVIKRSRI